MQKKKEAKGEKRKRKNEPYAYGRVRCQWSVHDQWKYESAGKKLSYQGNQVIIIDSLIDHDKVGII